MNKDNNFFDRMIDEAVSHLNFDYEDLNWYMEEYFNNEIEDGHYQLFLTNKFPSNNALKNKIISNKEFQNKIDIVLGEIIEDCANAFIDAKRSAKDKKEEIEELEEEKRLEQEEEKREQEKAEKENKIKSDLLKTLTPKQKKQLKQISPNIFSL
jgi:hypothetical protein